MLEIFTYHRAAERILTAIIFVVDLGVSFRPRVSVLTPYFGFDSVWSYCI